MKFERFAFAPICMLLACGEVSPPTNADQPASSKEVTFTRTLVRLKPDGTQDVTSISVTAADQEAERALLLKQLAANTGRTPDPALLPKAPASSVDPSPDPAGKGVLVGQSAEAISRVSCTAYDMILFDQNNYAGNEICFSGKGTALLGSYIDFCSLFCLTWEYTLRSWLDFDQFEIGYFETPRGLIHYFKPNDSDPAVNYAPVESINFQT
jgi:hypothetical protein